jgi:hypothetical protein
MAEESSPSIPVPAAAAAAAPFAALNQLLNGKAPLTVLGVVLAFVLFYLWPQIMTRFDMAEAKLVVVQDKIVALSSLAEARLLRLEVNNDAMAAATAKWDKHCEDARELGLVIMDLKRRLERLEKP